MKDIRIRLINIINYLSVFIIFSGTFTFPLGAFELRMSYFIALLVLLLLPAIKDIVLSKIFFFPFLLIILASIYSVVLGRDNFMLLSKQVIGISFNAAFFYLIFKINGFNVKKIFKVYFNLAFLVAFIGLIQWLSFSFGFKPGYNLGYILNPKVWMWNVHLESPQGSIRINSILPEPSGFVVCLMPAFFFALVSFLRRGVSLSDKIKGLIIILAFLLSQSSTGYIGISLSILLVIINYCRIRYYIFAVILAFVFIFLVYNKFEVFKIRVDHTIQVIKEEKSLQRVNFSTYTLYTNARIAFESFKRSPLIGSGLGSHELSYDTFIGSLKYAGRARSNTQDATSLFLRLMSETGLAGIALFFIFMFKYHLRRSKDPSDYLWIINNAVLALFFVRLLHVGHYFSDGFFMFFWLYFFSAVIGRLPQGGMETKKEAS